MHLYHQKFSEKMTGEISRDIEAIGVNDLRACSVMNA